jgi:hypothetical protein
MVEVRTESWGEKSAFRTHLRLCRRHINRQSGFHTCYIESIGDPSASRHRPATIWALLAVVAVEFAGVLALGILLLVEVLTVPPASLATAIALVVLAGLTAVVLGAVVVGIWRGRAWVRAASVVFQVLLFAIGVGALQGALAQPGWGWPLIIVAVIGFVLGVARPTADWLSGRDAAS